MRRKLIILVLLLILSIPGFTACLGSTSPQALFNIDSQEVSKIEITSGNSGVPGVPFTITDRTIIDELVSAFNLFTYTIKSTLPESPPPGWNFYVAIYDADTAPAYVFVVIGDTITYGEFSYESSKPSGTFIKNIQSIYNDLIVSGADDWAKAELTLAFNTGVVSSPVANAGWKNATTRPFLYNVPQELLGRLPVPLIHGQKEALYRR